MKKASLMTAVLFALGIVACNKSADTSSSISLTPSASTAIVGETVSVTLTSSANASKWTVSPSSAKQTYSVTTSKINYYTFTQPGVYTVAVSAKSVVYDSTTNESLDSCWLHSGNRAACVKGVDSASTQIVVTK